MKNYQKIKLKMKKKLTNLNKKLLIFNNKIKFYNKITISYKIKLMKNTNKFILNKK